MSRLTSSFTCQLVSVIIPTFVIHHSFTPGSNLPFQQILPTLILLLPSSTFTIMGPDKTYHAYRYFFVRFSLIFLFVPCGGLSWLHISFLLHVKYTLSYRSFVVIEKSTDCATDGVILFQARSRMSYFGLFGLDFYFIFLNF